jgi:CheY-like chemotaxis protein
MRRKKILVIDDCRDILDLLRVQLIYLGWDPVLASSGEEALDRLYRIKPRVILLDIRMPGMNGLELARFLTTVNSQIPIVAMTAFALAGDGRRYLEAGCRDWISKPFTMAELRERLERLAVQAKSKQPSPDAKRDEMKNIGELPL